ATCSPESTSVDTVEIQGSCRSACSASPQSPGKEQQWQAYRRLAWECHKRETPALGKTDAGECPTRSFCRYRCILFSQEDQCIAEILHRSRSDPEYQFWETV